MTLKFTFFYEYIWPEVKLVWNKKLTFKRVHHKKETTGQFSLPPSRVNCGDHLYTILQYLNAVMEFYQWKQKTYSNILQGVALHGSELKLYLLTPLLKYSSYSEGNRIRSLFQFNAQNMINYFWS